MRSLPRFASYDRYAASIEAAYTILSRLNMHDVQFSQARLGTHPLRGADCSRFYNAVMREVQISAHNPLMERHDTYYGISEDGKTAFIEMASISGLPLVPPEKRNPMLTTSYGTGELIRDALERGCRNFIIGLRFPVSG